MCGGRIPAVRLGGIVIQRRDRTAGGWCGSDIIIGRRILTDKLQLGGARILTVGAIREGRFRGLLVCIVGEKL